MSAQFGPADEIIDVEEPTIDEVFRYAITRDRLSRVVKPASENAVSAVCILRATRIVTRNANSYILPRLDSAADAKTIYLSSQLVAIQGFSRVQQGSMPVGMEDLRRVRGIETRRGLIEAAVISVSMHGLSGTTLSTVAEQAGVSRASVGFHFNGKGQLLAAALQHALSLYETGLRETVSLARREPRARLAAMMRHDVTFPTRYPQILSLWFAVWGEAQSLDLYRSETLPHDLRCRNELRDLAYAITQDARLAAQFASLSTSFVLGTWLEHHLDPGTYDVDVAREAGLQIISMLRSPKRAKTASSKAGLPRKAGGK